MTHKILQLRNEREKFRKLLKIHPFDQKIEQNYKNFRNAVINEISEAKKNYYQNEYEQCKSNTNEKWKFINKMLNRQSSTDSITQCLENGNEKVTSPQEIAETFNIFSLI